MNCEDFRDNLHEYLDDSLPARIKEAARAHLRGCIECREALRHEEAVAQQIRHSLQHATEGLSLSPGTVQRVLKAWEADNAAHALGTFERAWHWFVSSAFRPAAAAAAVLIGVLILLVLPAGDESGNPPAAVLRVAEGTRVVDVPLQTHTRLFRRQDNLVVDTLASSVAVGHARFAEHKPTPKSR